jgi:hypothetical protein
MSQRGALQSSETSETPESTTQRHIPRNAYLQQHGLQNLSPLNINLYNVPTNAHLINYSLLLVHTGPTQKQHQQTVCIYEHNTVLPNNSTTK